MTPYLNLKKEEEEKLIKTWNIIAKRLEKFNYKPTEITEKQIDFINELIRFLDRREASTLIELLNVLNKKKEEFLISKVENKPKKLSSYQNNLNKIRIKYPKAYSPWTQEDDLLLESKIKEGYKISLVKIFERKPSAIKSRIKELRLKLIKNTI